MAAVCHCKFKDGIVVVVEFDRTFVCVVAEIVHKPLNQFWTGNCSAGDLLNKFRPACGAAITRWPFKLFWVRATHLSSPIH